jgi:hypothetical protein
VRAPHPPGTLVFDIRFRDEAALLLRAQELLGTSEAALQAVLKLLVTAASVDVLGDCGANYLGYRLVVDGRNRLELFRLICGEPDRHSFSGLHTEKDAMTAPGLSTTAVAWYHGCRKEDRMSPSHDDQHEVHGFKIQIDRVHYTVTKHEMTGLELRNVPPTPIGADRDLFEVVPGHPDRKIADADVIEITNGKRFFTAPGHINPGRM